MMSRWRTVVLVVLALALLALAGSMHPRLLEQRRAYHLDVGDPLEDTPPLVAFTSVALGGFRGMLTDLLWLRVSRLQQEGEFFEIVQLSDWITMLEPRFPAVWAFHAWNMAYNISVMLPLPDERWRWVRHGIELLRDKALHYNPGSAPLYWELGWLLQHKVGAPYDSAHIHYQKEWAREMTELLGGPRLEDVGIETDQILRDRLKAKGLDPVAMNQVDKAYGPLDWRLPETHAIYWAHRGLPHAAGFDRVSLDRMVCQCLGQLVLTGTLKYDAQDGSYARSPNPDLFPQADKAFAAAVLAHPEQSNMPVAWRSFLAAAAPVLRAAEAAAVDERLRAEWPGLGGD